MFCRNVWSATELTINCKSVFQHKSEVSGYGRQLFRKSFHNSRRSARRPGLDPDPLQNLPLDARPLHARGLVRPFLFTIGVSTVSLAGCVIWEYENLRTHASTMLRRPSTWLSAQQKKLMNQYARDREGQPAFNHQITDLKRESSEGLSRKKSHRSEPGPLSKWWNSLRDSEQVFYPILAANVLVFGAWRVRALQPFMVKYFCSNPSSSAVCLPMVLSTFSHYSALHLAANMYVLYSFMPAAIAALGKEQFVAMYLSAGVISSFSSIMYKVILNQPGLSLGASGAIMSVLSYVCMQYPDTKLSIIFLPMYTFAAGTAIKVIMSVDLAGVVFGWKFFDHAAHLGGALFGIAWCHWGGTHLWGNRDKFLQYYDNLRKNDSGR